MVEHIFKSSKLLTVMQSSISDLISSFNDTQVLHQIADSFAKKKDNLAAEGVYGRILEIDPEDEKAIRKKTYFQALRDPASINIDNLPPVDLIDDMDTLRSIEINYLNYKMEGQSKGPASGPVSEVSKMIKKRRKKNIRWPQGFDPKNPPKTRPDEERWLPKLERAKYRGLAKKKGYMKKTQGTSNIDETATRGTFQKGPSTATAKTVKSGNKYNKNKKKR
jgi:SRP72 RNA-binding domain